MNEPTNLKGTTGTIEVLRADSDARQVPATVLWHYQSPRGRDVIHVQHDAVAPDTHAITRNIAGREERFRRNRHGNWVSLDRSPYWFNKKMQPHANKFHPGAQRYEAEQYPF